MSGSSSTTFRELSDDPAFSPPLAGYDSPDVNGLITLVGGKETMPESTDNVIPRTFGFCCGRSRVDANVDLGPFTKHQMTTQLDGDAVAAKTRLLEMTDKDATICRTSFPDDYSYAETMSVNLFRYVIGACPTSGMCSLYLLSQVPRGSQTSERL